MLLWAHELPLLPLLKPMLSKEPFCPALAPKTVHVLVHTCFEMHIRPDQGCILSVHPVVSLLMYRHGRCATASAQKPVVALKQHLPLSDCSEGASGGLEDDVASPGRRDSPPLAGAPFAYT